MKNLVFFLALLCSTSLVAQFHFNENGTGIESATNTASGDRSTAMGNFTIAPAFASTAMGRETTASGDYSTAMGNGTTASGSRSTAMGQSTTASGFASTTMGQVTRAIGDWSTAMGYRTEAGGSSSTSMGRETKAIGNYSTAMGYYTTASISHSTAMGYYTTASGYVSTAMGAQTTASGSRSTAMGGETTASGDYSTAMGYQTEASDRSSLVIGQYNLLGSTVTNSATQFSTENTAFVIGNGTANDSRSDALTVLFDGTTTIAGDLSINSDARLKANIISLGSTLAKLLLIDGKTYTMKKDENKKQKIGVLAQDIEKVFPELVSESHGVKSVNYQGLVPVLINALKEQDAMMKEQDNRLSKQQNEIDELKTMLKAIIEKT